MTLTMHCGRFLVVAIIAYWGVVGSAVGQSARRDGLWTVVHDDKARVDVHTMEISIHPASEPLPALKYELIPGPAERLPGNAAIHYLKALGFLEQDSVRERIIQFRREQLEQLKQRGADSVSAAPPMIWLEQRPDEIPLQEVKQYLSYFSFQVRYLKEAASRDRFDMDRQIERLSDLYRYPLPEVQVMRELARTQSLRLRVALAERRIEDALEILGQQFALARHLGQDEFLVSNLVGMAIAKIAWQDALLFVQEPEAPSLYWAIARLPKPLVSTERAIANEWNFVFQQFEKLRDVDTRPRPASYWREFIKEIWADFASLDELIFRVRLPTGRPEYVQAGSAAFVIAAYPGARRYLRDQWRIEEKQLDDYPTAQVVALATVRFYEQWRDEYFKWFSLPLSEARRHPEYQTLESRFHRAVREVGPAALLANAMLPAIGAVPTASARTDDALNMLAAVEAIRLFSGKHGKLPDSLDDLGVPAHVIVGSSGPLRYRREGDRGVLIGNTFPGVRYQLVLKLSPR